MNCSALRPFVGPNSSLFRCLRLIGKIGTLVLCLVVFSTDRDGLAEQPVGLPEVKVKRPVSQKVTHYLRTAGTVSANDKVDLVARVVGFLQDIRYSDGQPVKKDDVLFVIQPEEYEIAVQNAQAGVAETKATLANAEAEFKREAALVRRDTISRSKFDTARANRDAARAELQAARAGLRLADLELSYTKIKAPFDGVVTAHKADPGALVGTDTTVPLATIITVDPIYVEFSLSERDLLALRTGLRRQRISSANLNRYAVEVGLPDQQEYRFVGSLDYVSPEIEKSTGTALVRAVFPNPDRDLIPGGFVKVRLPLQIDVPSFVIPSKAIGTDQSGRFVMIVGKDNVLEQRQITLGVPLKDGLQAIDSGLSAADRVVIGNLHSAIRGRTVKPVE